MNKNEFPTNGKDAPNDILYSEISTNTYYGKSFSKLDFLKGVAVSFKKPHYPCLNIVRDQGSYIQYRGCLHSEELQNSDIPYTKEIEDNPIFLKNIYNNKEGFISSGGIIVIGFNAKADGAGVDITRGFITSYKNNPFANRNFIEFQAVKMFNIYENYIYSEVRGEDIFNIYDKLGTILPEMKNIKTQTVISVLDEDRIREVTLHSFGIYGNILTAIDLKIK